MKRSLARYILLAVVALFFAACGKNDPDPTPTTYPDSGSSEKQDDQPAVVTKYKIKKISEMTLEEKVAQMFFIRLESLDPDYAGQSNAKAPTRTSLTDGMKSLYAKYPVGGVTLFAKNITTPEQIVSLNSDLHSLTDYPLISVDEEGGKVARIANNSNFQVTKFENMYTIGSLGDPTIAYNVGKTIGAYLKEYGFDIDFAPVADVFTNPSNTVIGTRAFSSDPQAAGTLVSKCLTGLKDSKVEGCLKHFPGHGDTSTDSHYGYAETKKTWEQMLSCEMIPFKSGISSGAKMIMTAHIGAPNVTGEEVPASLSKKIITDKLRGELGYKGIVITDAIEMGAITNQYTVEDATLKAIEAGCDIVLMPLNFVSAYDTVVNAVKTGVITEARINESVERILQLKRDILTSRGQLEE